MRQYASLEKAPDIQRGGAVRRPSGGDANCAPIKPCGVFIRSGALFPLWRVRQVRYIARVARLRAPRHRRGVPRRGDTDRVLARQFACSVRRGPLPVGRPFLAVRQLGTTFLDGQECPSYMGNYSSRIARKLDFPPTMPTLSPETAPCPKHSPWQLAPAKESGERVAGRDWRIRVFLGLGRGRRLRRRGARQSL
jgi:hypothetical protein